MQRELRPENAQIYHCSGCGDPLHVEQPKGLKGRFFHSACYRTLKRISYGVLNAEVIS